MSWGKQARSSQLESEAIATLQELRHCLRRLQELATVFALRSTGNNGGGGELAALLGGLLTPRSRNGTAAVAKTEED